MKIAGGLISSDSEAKKKHVIHDTFTKWQRDYNRALRLIRLECLSQFDHGKKAAMKLSCSICEGESVEQYITELYKLTESCDYTEIEELIRDRLVVGFKDSTLSEQLQL